jgi:hypothetical protein
MGLKSIISDGGFVEGEATTPAEAPDLDTEVVVEQVWKNLRGMIDHSTIRKEVARVIPKYASATVTNFIPIFIHRETIKRLTARSRGD